tara:strand:- start:34 stop:177 length:144 start_codon:yes stop_codon:yes gene_type:complete
MITKETINKYRLKNYELLKEADNDGNPVLYKIGNSIERLLNQLEEEL